MFGNGNDTRFLIDEREFAGCNKEHNIQVCALIKACKISSKHKNNHVK